MEAETEGAVVRLANLEFRSLSFAGVGINLLTVRLGQFGEVFAW